MTNIFHRDAVDAAGPVPERLRSLTLHIAPYVDGGCAMSLTVDGKQSAMCAVGSYAAAIDHGIAWLREQRERIGEKR